MTQHKHLFGAVAALALTCGAAAADPAIIYDLGGKFDKSFNEAAFEGAQRWATETGGTFKELEMQSEAQREQGMRRLAESGANPVVLVGFAFSDVVGQVAADYPNTKFSVIDGWGDAPNLQVVSFAEHEGSYLVGLMAGMASKSNTVGFIGGMDVPTIRRFACGYTEGVKASNPSAKVIINMTGDTGAAWNDPTKGAELTKSQISQGADVVYHAAGGTGIGVLQAAADGGILGIGVDKNQNYLHPGQVLTSMIKRVDQAVFNAFNAGSDLQTGQINMDLSSGGVGVAMDEYNATLVSPEMLNKVEEISNQIKEGTLKVHNYTSDDTCPSANF